MTVEAFLKEAELTALCMPDPEREVKGAYIGDLLSWVMGRACSDNVWITIMSNVNIVAVATLADTSCILLAEGVIPEADVLDTAMAKGVNILSSKLSAFELASKISHLVI